MTIYPGWWLPQRFILIRSFILSKDQKHWETTLSKARTSIQEQGCKYCFRNPDRIMQKHSAFVSAINFTFSNLCTSILLGFNVLSLNLLFYASSNTRHFLFYREKSQLYVMFFILIRFSFYSLFHSFLTQLFWHFFLQFSSTFLLFPPLRYRSSVSLLAASIMSDFAIRCPGTKYFPL